MGDDAAPRSACLLTITTMHDRPGLILAGEADVTAADLLRTALAALPIDGARDIHLDLAGLRFIDVACTAELIAWSERRPGIKLIAHRAPTWFTRIQSLLYPNAKIRFDDVLPGSQKPPGPLGKEQAERAANARI